MSINDLEDACRTTRTSETSIYVLCRRFSFRLKPNPRKVGGVVSLGFGELVVNEPNRLVEFGNDNVFKDVDTPASHLRFNGK